MTKDENPSIKTRIERIRKLSEDGQGSESYYQAAILSQSVLHDTVGGAHPIMTTIADALKAGNWLQTAAASRSVIALYEDGALQSPRLAVAHEIEGNLLDIAQAQIVAAETEADLPKKQVRLAIAAFLAGAALEDALRRLCDARGLPYDAQHATIAKLQAALYQPSKQVEIISGSENKQITAWGATRNEADHGHFTKITHSEVMAMALGVRGFVDKHLP